MSKVLNEMIENGEIYRKRVCDRCGAVDYAKMTGWKKEEWREDEPSFAFSAFTEIFVPGRGKTLLCGPCSAEIRKICDTFMRPPAKIVEN